LVVQLSFFEERLDKISLALMSSVEAKEQSVKEFGIGEDIAMNLFCWDGPVLKLMLQTRPDIQASSDGFSTTALPAASAGATVRPNICAG
jgi:hypothetical protein